MSRNLAHQVGGVDVESLGEIQHDRECRNVLSTFDESDVADAQFRSFGKYFLCEPAFASKLSNE